MRRALGRRGVFGLVFFALFLSFIGVGEAEKEKKKGGEGERDSSSLAQRIDGALDARKKKDYKDFFTYHHPLYRAIISEEEFVKKEGRLKLDMGEVDDSRSLPKKYEYIVSFPYRILSHKILNLYIDQEGRFGKVKYRLTRDVNFAVPVPGPLIVQTIHFDYWEKIEGQWYLIAKKRAQGQAHMSGAPLPQSESKILFPEEHADYREVKR